MQYPLNHLTSFSLVLLADQSTYKNDFPSSLFKQTSRSLTATIFHRRGSLQSLNGAGTICRCNCPWLKENQLMSQSVFKQNHLHRQLSVFLKAELPFTFCLTKEKFKCEQSSHANTIQCNLKANKANRTDRIVH